MTRIHASTNSSAFSLSVLIALPGLGCQRRALAQPAAGTPGIVSHLLVLSDKSEDVSSPEAWAKTYIKPGMSDQEKALAIWKTVVRYRHQTNPPNEFLSPETNVHDPLKTIHVYGVGICCCASSNVCGLARYLDMKARGRAINVHMISEVFYGGGWHMIDGSLMNYFFMPDGTIAPADEIHRAVAQWHEKNPGYRGDWGKLAQFAANGNWRKAGPPLLATCPMFLESGFNPAGVHGWHATMGEYDYQNAPEYEYWPSMGYQLNVQLREGEKLTRNWSNKGKLIDWVDADIAGGRQEHPGPATAAWRQGPRPRRQRRLGIPRAAGQRRVSRRGPGGGEPGLDQRGPGRPGRPREGRGPARRARAPHAQQLRLCVRHAGFQGRRRQRRGRGGLVQRQPGPGLEKNRRR